jgi:prepilin-type N-terminal cleavage/methylation domain-containing protein
VNTILMTLTYKKNQSGFSLVEIMISMLLSLALAAAVIAVFVNNSYSFNQDENVARMQDDARHALREIAFEIGMAGHYADLHIPDIVTADADLSIGVDCGPAGEVNWMYRTVETGTENALSLTAIDNVTNAEVVAAHSCFADNEVLPGTDVVSIKRVAGQRTDVPVTNAVYLRTNGTVGLLYRAPFPATPSVTVATPRADWAYSPSIYYVRQFANTPGDGNPTLCRKVLRGAGPNMTTECLATGIENLQIEYGIDTSEDGHPNIYLTAPTLQEIQNVVTARIFLLARTSEIDTRYTNDKTYSVSNSADYTPGDSFHRRVVSTSATVRNIRSMNMMGY